MYGYKSHSWVLALVFLATQAVGSNGELTRIQTAAEELGVTPREQALLRPEIQRYVAFGGDADNLVDVIEAGLDRACTNTCLLVLVQGMVEAMDYGVQDRRAGDLVIGVLDQQLARRDELGVSWNGNQLAAHLKRSLMQWLDAHRSRQRARLLSAAR